MSNVTSNDSYGLVTKAFRPRVSLAAEPHELQFDRQGDVHHPHGNSPASTPNCDEIRHLKFRRRASESAGSDLSSAIQKGEDRVRKGGQAASGFPRQH
jgi:hypothetical protein